MPANFSNHINVKTNCILMELTSKLSQKNIDGNHAHTSVTHTFNPPQEISDNLYSALKDSCESCNSRLISLSGGLDSTIIAHFLKEQKPRGLAIITKDFVATDLTYCQMAAQKMEIPLSIHIADMKEILEAIEETIQILRNFNDIEIRNSIVMYMSAKWARDRGERTIITGDGADELFAGYNFLIKKPQKELEEEIKRVCAIMHFPTHKIGEALGVKIESPFLDNRVQNIAKEISPDLKVRNENNVRYGKWILRKIFDRYIPSRIAWRQKSPMQDGSGTAKLTHMFESFIRKNDFVEKRKAIQDKDGITIRSSESMYYYNIFRKHFGPPGHVKVNSCPYCRAATGGSKFCRMCGAFPI